jgi:ATP-dependent Clp protease ATP-binding subunit ClpC
MWQRFTERARRVVFFAQEEAGRLGENYVASEHLLLGLVRENDSVAAHVLDSMGVSLVRIRSEIEKQVTPGTGHLGQDMQLTPRGKRVIDLAYDEARNLSNNYIGTEHLLLGLIREGEGLAGRALAKLGVDLARARKEVKTLQDNQDTGGRGKSFEKRFEALSPDVQVALQGEGVAYANLPAEMQAMLTYLTTSVSGATVSLENASVRVQKSQATDSPGYAVFLTTTLSIYLSV